MQNTITHTFFSVVDEVQKRWVRLICLCILGLLTLAIVTATWAEEEPDSTEDLVVSEQRENALERALAGHRVELADLKAQTGQLEALPEEIAVTIEASRRQNSTHRQLLLVSRLRIEDLENAINNNLRRSQALSKQVEDFNKRWDSTSNFVQLTDERIELARNQILNLLQSPLPDAQKWKLETLSSSLLRVLDQKKKLGNYALETYKELVIRLEDVLEKNQLLGEKLKAQLENQSRASLFTRTDRIRQLSSGDLPDALAFFERRIRTFFSVAAWKAQWAQIKLRGFSQWGLFLLLLLVALTALQGRFRILLKRVATSYEKPGQFYRRLALRLLQRSLLLSTMTLLFGIYSTFEMSLLDIGLDRFLFKFLRLFLITQWGLDYLAIGFQNPASEVRAFVCMHLTRYFWFLRGILAPILLLHWVVGTTTPLAILSYDVLGVVSMVWVFIFWRSIEPVVAKGVRHGQAAPDPKRMFLLKAWSYLVFGGFMISNLAGYSFLAEHWLGAWMKTVALLFWGFVVRKAIWEWEQDHRAQSATGIGNQPLGSAYHLRWSLIQVVWLIWLVILVAGGGLIWDQAGYLMPVMKRFFDYTFTLGTLELSIKGVVSAAIILFVTHVSVRIGRTILREKVLDHQSLERGLKHSILTITGYLGWSAGLVLALGTLGVNSTSLAVVFGALSIGIGFGMQTIFNNFISGLILLFERPIQVGDFVEINGLWAEVKKINVRATVVQTFDNASVIIPNSEFVSQQVTNWSFKDKRMRRNLEVGVAYGSDIEKVTTTMLEIAREAKTVLKYPQPEVLFIDHADSALIFRLRVWLHVDDYWATVSQIRTNIDRRFREEGIEIAFPQRDLHIRTIAGGITPAPASIKD